jgi:hypothetical protein
MDAMDNTFTLIVKGHEFKDVQLGIRELSPQFATMIDNMEGGDNEGTVNLDKFDSLDKDTMEFILNHLEKVDYKPQGREMQGNILPKLEANLTGEEYAIVKHLEEHTPTNLALILKYIAATDVLNIEKLR